MSCIPSFFRKNSVSFFSKKQLFFLSAALSFLFLVLIVTCCDVKYEVSDDFIMEAVLSGAFSGSRDAHILFSNYFWGMLLLPLYRLFPSVSWYFFSLILVGYLALLAVTRLILQRHSLLHSAILLALLYLFTARDLFLLVQFTKTAAAAALAGGLLYLDALQQHFSQELPVSGRMTKTKASSFLPRTQLLCGTLLFLAGSLIRFYAVYTVLPFLFISYIAELVLSRSSAKKALSLFFASVLLLLVSYAFKQADTLVYQSDPDYRYYREYSSLRGNILDYPLPDYEAFEDAFLAAGVSRTDYEMIRNWEFGDDSVFSVKMLSSVLEIAREFRRQNPMTFPAVIKGLLGRFYLAYPGFRLCVLSGLLWLFAFRGRIRLFPFFLCIPVLLLLGYFEFRGRCIYRIEFCILFSAAVLMAAGFRELKPVQWKPSIKLFSLLICLFICLWQAKVYLPDSGWYLALSDEDYRSYVDDTFYYSWNYSYEKYTKVLSKRTIRPAFWDEVRSHPENVYLLDFNTCVQTLYYDCSPFESAASSFPENLIYLGGVTVNHPAVEAALDRYGIDQPLRGLLEGTNETDGRILFVSTGTADLVLAWLQEHYDSSAFLSLYAQFDGYSIWEYHSSENSSK